MDNYDLLSPDQLRMASRRMRTELDNLYKVRLSSACAACLQVHQLYATVTALLCFTCWTPQLEFILKEPISEHHQQASKPYNLQVHATHSLLVTAGCKETRCLRFHAVILVTTLAAFPRQWVS